MPRQLQGVAPTSHSFHFEQATLEIQAAPEATQIPVATYHTVTGHYDRHGISSHGLPNSSGCTWRANLAGYLTVGACLSIRNVSHSQPNPTLESCCPAQIQRLVEENLLAVEILLQLRFQAIKPGITVEPLFAPTFE
jgi:hypothetical protein